MEDSKEECSTSNPQDIPKQPLLKLDFHSASFVSQRSSSLESSSPTNSSDGNLMEPDHPIREHTSMNYNESAASEETVAERNNAALTADDSNSSQQWLGDESVPSSMMPPEHQSTPLKEGEYLSTVSEEDGGSTSGENQTLGKENKDSKEDTYMPGDLNTPIMGYETMEARSRFTVFKIQVQKSAANTSSSSELEANGWFVFRRYSDFVHLNGRLKYLFPGFRLSLPPKRWFRDNFDKDFLEDRVLGLQAFLDNITGHKDICNSPPVRAFFCTDDPPGPHDSLEESRALCDTLEETVYTLRQDLQEKDAELALVKEELELYKSQVELLSAQLRVLNSRKDDSAPTRPARYSLAECDLDTAALPVSPPQTVFPDSE